MNDEIHELEQSHLILVATLSRILGDRFAEVFAEVEKELFPNPGYENPHVENTSK